MYSTIYRTAKSVLPEEQKKQRILGELERTQWLSRPELGAFQFTKLQSLIKSAYEHVPFYGKRLRDEDIHPEDVKTLKDFQALPFLTREDVNNHLADLVCPDSRGHLRLSETGGSTGEPMRFLVDDSFNLWNGARARLTRGWYGVRDGDKVAWVWGAQRDMPGWSPEERLMARIKRHRHLNAFNMTEATMQAFAEMLVHWQPVMFRAYASALSVFAQHVKERGITSIRPRLIETTAEKLTDPQRQLLEEVFDCPVADCYSSREFSCIAYQCERGGLHVCPTRYLEVVANGNAAEPGQLGEVVITSLHQFAMPLLRYKIGDRGIYESGDCPCGRGLPVLREIVGRADDLLTTTDGQVVHGGFFDHLFCVRPDIVRFQVYQPDRQHLEIRLVCKQDVDSEWLEGVRTEIRARFGDSTEISLQLVDRIELTPTGKHRFIVSEVAPGAGQGP
jgi:phenylacetate-CoA ligase